MQENKNEKVHTIKWKDYLYLYSLYFKRGTKISVFYIIMLVLCLVIPGFLIESNAKIKDLISEVNKLLPPNRIKLVIPTNERATPQKGFLSSLFKIKSESNKQDNRKYKDFITPEMLNSINKVEGVSRVVPLYSIDFPMGIVFSVPGSNTPIQTQMIGSGLNAKDAQEFIHPESSIQDFTYKKGKKVPILMSRFILPVVNTIAQNNGVSGFQLTEKDLLGYTIKVFVGKTSLSDAFSRLGNSDQKDVQAISDVDFSDIIECTIVGFIDMDYSIGLAFPQTFLDIYKNKYWANFSSGFYDSLVVDIPFSENERLQNIFIDSGYQIGEDTGILNKISTILQKQQQWFGIFLQFISIIILVFGIIILFFIIAWMLQGKTLEFSVYQFFGSSTGLVVLLYTSYLCTLNLIAFLIASLILFSGFGGIESVIYSLKDKVPTEYHSIFNADFINHFIVLDSLLIYGFIFLGIVSFVFVYRYIQKINNNM